MVSFNVFSSSLESSNVFFRFRVRKNGLTTKAIKLPLIMSKTPNASLGSAVHQCLGIYPQYLSHRVFYPLFASTSSPPFLPLSKHLLVVLTLSAPSVNSRQRNSSRSAWSLVSCSSSRSVAASASSSSTFAESHSAAAPSARTPTVGYAGSRSRCLQATQGVGR